MNHFVHFIINILLISFITGGLCLSCGDCRKYPQDKHINTKNIGKGLYSERWVAHQYGAFANNTIAYFITDSTSFVMFLGLCDDVEYYDFTWYSDSILLVSKVNRISGTTINTKYMSYNTIRNSGEKLTENYQLFSTQ